MADTYACARCGQIYPKIWSDQEAKAEYYANFGTEDISDIAVICDDCYQKFMRWYKGE